MERRAFDRAAAGLNREVREALWQGLEEGFLRLTVEDAHAALELPPGELYAREIRLFDVSGLPEGEIDLSSLCDAALERREGAYTLTGTLRGEVFELRFAGAALRSWVFRPDEPPDGTPWERLRAAAWGIFEKELAAPDLMSERERELMPWVRELCGFSPLGRFYGELAGAEGAVWAEKKRKRSRERLLKELDRAEYKPLWRELAGRLARAWAGLPSRAELCLPPQVLSAVRGEADRRLAARGYEGEYPDYIRVGPILGVRLGSAYGQMYFVGPERRAEPL